MFDKDSNGVVDLGELFCGISLLCAGSRGEKLKAAFDLFDESKDGFVQFDELVRYFEAVFSISLEGLEGGKLKIPIDKLARATAKNCFGCNSQDIFDGKLTFGQLKKWHDETGSRII